MVAISSMRAFSPDEIPSSSIGPLGCVRSVSNVTRTRPYALPRTPAAVSAEACGAATRVGPKLARRLRAGQVDINGGAFNSNAPVGGYKQSGIGSENIKCGMEVFLEYKSIQFTPA